MASRKKAVNTNRKSTVIEKKTVSEELSKNDTKESVEDELKRTVDQNIHPNVPQASTTNPDSDKLYGESDHSAIEEMASSGDMETDLTHDVLTADILIVDDDPTIRMSMGAYLERRDYQIFEAVDGKDALNQINSRVFDLVLLDLRLPEIDGLTILAKINRSHPNLPVVIVSGTGMISDVVEALRLGAADFLLKPVESMAVLLHTVQSVLEKSRLAKQLRAYQTHLQEMVDRRTEQLAEKNIMLRHEISQRQEAQRQLERTIGELEARNAELKQFAHTVAHDLRTPLITIKSYIDLIRRDLPRNVTKSVERNLESVGIAARRMFQLLEDVLKISRLGRAGEKHREVPMELLVRESIELVRGSIIERGVVVKIVDKLPTVSVVPTKIVELLQNLIENAVKYMGPQANPRIEIGLGKPLQCEDHTEIVFFVRDNGIGISPEYHKTVFNLFEQLDPDGSGTGIGLSVVKRVVEVHGGRVWIDSKGEGQGTTIFFSLPEKNVAGHELPYDISELAHTKV